MRARYAGDGKLPKDRPPPRAIALIDVDRWAHDDGLRSDVRLAKRARRPHPAAVQGRRDQQARSTTAQARQRLQERLLQRARTSGVHLGQVLHELAELLVPTVGVKDLGAMSVRDEADIAVR